MKKWIKIWTLFPVFALLLMSMAPPAVPYTILDLFAGISNIIVFPVSSTIWGAGYNHFGQLGQGDAEEPNPHTVWEMSHLTIPDNDFPGPINGAAGESHTVILLRDGTLWGAGESFYGELGQGKGSPLRYPVLTQLKNENGSDFSDVLALAAGCNNTFLLKKDNSLWASGHNYYGELGLGDRENRHVFTRVSGAGDDVMDVAAGSRHTVILKNDGSVWAAGYNFNGQLGLGDEEDFSVFTKVTDIGNDAVAIAAGNYHTVVLKKDGSVWVTGENYYNQLGNNGDGRRNFVRLKDSDGSYIEAVAVAARGDMTIIQKRDGKLMMAGSYSEPEYDIDSGLRPPLRGEPEPAITEIKPSGDYRFGAIKKIVLGSRSIYVLTADGFVWAAGSNQYGQLIMNRDVKESAVLRRVYPRS